MTLYNLVIPEERKDKETNEVKTYWHRVGTASCRNGIFSEKR